MGENLKGWVVCIHSTSKAQSSMHFPYYHSIQLPSGLYLHVYAIVSYLWSILINIDQYWYMVHQKALMHANCLTPKPLGDIFCIIWWYFHWHPAASFICLGVAWYILIIYMTEWNLVNKESTYPFRMLSPIAPSQILPEMCCRLELFSRLELSLVHLRHTLCLENTGIQKNLDSLFVVPTIFAIPQ